jgi:hypothetical protein
MSWSLVRVKRWWVPEWLWRFLARWNLPVHQPLRALLTAKPDRFTQRRINGPDLVPLLGEK